jgi:hypothetical protein
MAAGPLFADQLRAHAQLLDAQLADGRPFLLGEDFSLALGVAIALAPPLGIARESKPATPITPDPHDPNGFEPGMRVRVVADDYGFDPVEGEIVALEIHGIAIRREAPEVGEVVVHFPRAGFRVSKL